MNTSFKDSSFLYDKICFQTINKYSWKEASHTRCIPENPGVYFLYDQNDTLLYIGQSKNLKNRLSQYKNAQKNKIKDKTYHLSQCIEKFSWELHSHVLFAKIREIFLIQQHSPPWNELGRSFVFYPYIGLQFKTNCFSLTITHQKDLISGFQFFGAYKSPYLTRKSFFCLMKLFSYVFKNVKKKNFIYTYSDIFLDISHWEKIWINFYQGHSCDSLTILTDLLLESDQGRKNSEKVEKFLKINHFFWKKEARPLQKAIQSAQISTYPIPQNHRDSLLMQAKYMKILKSI